MVKFFLALIFSLLTVLPPAEAFCCSENINATLPDCCISHVSSTPTVRDICCQMEGKDKVAPTFAFSTIANERHSFVASIGQFKLPERWLKADNASGQTMAGTPEHLASNKIYLLKRSLLI